MKTMAQNMVQKMFQMLIFAFIIASCIARPEGSIDSQEPSGDVQPNMSELEKLYSAYRFPQYFNMDEENPIDRLQLQYQMRLPYMNVAPLSRGNAGGNSLPYWNQLNQYRQLVTKRQTRYRQCYFNPISCFRK